MLCCIDDAACGCVSSGCLQPKGYPPASEPQQAHMPPPQFFSASMPASMPFYATQPHPGADGPFAFPAFSYPAPFPPPHPPMYAHHPHPYQSYGIPPTATPPRASRFRQRDYHSPSARSQFAQSRPSTAAGTSRHVDVTGNTMTKFFTEKLRDWEARQGEASNAMRQHAECVDIVLRSRL